jgi:hypothetical protein
VLAPGRCPGPAGVTCDQRRGGGGSPSRPTVPRRARSGRGGPCCPQACGPAAADSRARKVARHRQVRAVALDQAADDAGGIKHALGTDRRGQPGSARPCSVTSGIVPSLAPPGPRSRTRPCERPGSSTAVRLCGRARLTLPMLLPPRARLWDPLAAAAPGNAILCARASHGPVRRRRWSPCSWSTANSPAMSAAGAGEVCVGSVQKSTRSSLPPSLTAARTSPSSLRF